VATVGGPTLLEAARAFSPIHEPTGAAAATTVSEILKADGGRSPVNDSTDTKCTECAGLSRLPCFDCYTVSSHRKYLGASKTREITD
jgi:hypothetical protein